MRFESRGELFFFSSINCLYLSMHHDTRRGIRKENLSGVSDKLDLQTKKAIRFFYNISSSLI